MSHSALPKEETIVTWFADNCLLNCPKTLRKASIWTHFSKFSLVYTFQFTHKVRDHYEGQRAACWRTCFGEKLQHFMFRSKVFFILDTIHSLLTYAWSLLNSAQIRYRGHQFASLSPNFLGEGLRIPTNEREGGYPSILCPTWPLGPRKSSSEKKCPPFLEVKNLDLPHL